MNQDKIWNAFQNDPQLLRRFEAKPRLLSLIARIHPGQAILNIGVGDGSFEAMAQARGLDISSLDPSAQSIERLREQYGLGLKAQIGRADKLPFPESAFDVVVMSEVIEHLDDAAVAGTLKELERVLKPEGCLIGTVPADEDLLEGQVVCPHCGTQSHRWGHLQSFSRGRLNAILSTSFAQVAISRHYFADVARLNWKGRTFRVMKRMLLRLGVRGTGETFVFEARRT